MSNNKGTSSSPSLKRSWFHEIKKEFGKITWPTKDSLKKKSVVVLVIAAFLGLLIAGVDVALEWALSFIIG